MSGNILAIQKFMRGFHGIPLAHRHLQHSYRVSVRKDMLQLGNGDMEPVWLYNYDKKVARAKTIENEANGLLLDKNHDVVCMSFPRILDSTNEHKPKINWSSGVISTLAYDGIQVMIYSHKGKYFIRSKEDVIGDTILTCGKSVGHVVREILLEMVDTDKTNPHNDPFFPFKEANSKTDRYCWVFELIPPTETQPAVLVLLAVFNKELQLEIVTKYVSSFARSYQFVQPLAKTPAKEVFVESAVRMLDPEVRGIVVRDFGNRRVMYRNPLNKCLRQIKGDCPAARHFATLALMTDIEEIYDRYPQLEEMLMLMTEVLEEALDELDDLWNFHKDVGPRSIFAEAVLHHPLSKILFMVRDGVIQDSEDVLFHIGPKTLTKLTKSRYPKRFEAAYLAASSVAKVEELSC